MNLIIISSDYPYISGNAEFNILNLQLVTLYKVFSGKYIIPTGRIDGSINHFEGFTIINGFRRSNPQNILRITAVFFKFLNYLILDLSKIRLNKYFFFSLKESFMAYIKGIYFFIYISNFIKKEKIDLSKSLIYGFWFNDYIFGSLLLKKKFPKCKVVSGAHGHDLYNERRISNRIPFRSLSMEIIDFVVPDSTEGEEYLMKTNPKFTYKISKLNSGIERKHFKVKPSKDGILRIITLSRIHPVKRIDYLLRMLKKMETISQFKIHYHHIGGGENEKKLRELKENLNFKKFEINIEGRLSEIELNAFFKEKPIDVFLNVSSTEGTSVALIEAMSYSIPVIVTDVGGNKNIGNYCNTILPIEFTYKDLLDYFTKIHLNNSYREKLINLSYDYWEKFHDVELVNIMVKKLFKKIINI